MRKILIALLFVVTTSAHARFGVHGGINLGNMDLAAGGGPETSSGLLLGAIIDSSLGAIFDLEIDFNYIVKGYKVGDTAKLRLNYLEIPLYFKLRAPSPFVKPYLGFGPSIGFLLSASSDVTLLGSTVTTDVKSSFNTLDYGLNAGAGIEFKLGGLALVLDARYQLGLADVSQTTGTDKNKGIHLTAGLLFGW